MQKQAVADSGEVSDYLALLPCLRRSVRKYHRNSSASISSYNNDLWPSILILFWECIGCIVGLIGTEEPFCITIMSISGRQVEDEVCHLLPLPADLLSSSPDCSSLDEVMDTPAIPDRVMLSRRDMRRGANQRYRVHHVVLQPMHLQAGKATARSWSGLYRFCRWSTTNMTQRDQRRPDLALYLQHPGSACSV